MLLFVDFGSREYMRRTIRACLAFTFACVLLAGSSASIDAQEKLTPAQEQTLAQCLAGCKKGDANCQNSCTGKAATPAFVSAAGSCVRACADALAGPGQQQSRIDDLVQCVRACN